MNNSRRQFGFSLLEALMATGILGMGLVLIAMVFPVGIKLTSITAERTIGAIAANEAFAKIQLHGIRDFDQWTKVNPADDPYWMCFNYRHVINLKDTSTPPNFVDVPIDWPQFQYPSVAISAGQEPHKYHWSALCRAVDAQQVQTTVFVTRKAGEGLRYYTSAGGTDGVWPSPVPVEVQIGGTIRELEVLPGSWGADVFSFFGDNATIVANHDGRIYRVLEYKAVGGMVKNTLVLTEDWQPSAGPQIIWVVPPGVGSTRDPVIGVVQKTLLF